MHSARGRTAEFGPGMVAVHGLATVRQSAGCLTASESNGALPEPT
jgi:hypothetical protein